MAVKDYSTDPDANVQISGINIAEGCPPSGINNAIRQLMADVKEAQEAQEAQAAAQATKDAEQDEAIEASKGVLPLGFEYVRLTGQNAPLGGVDYMGQTATRAMYADLWAWLQEHKPDAIVSESEWQSLYASQNGNVAKYSTGDGSTTFRFPRVVGYLKGAESVDELGSYIKEGLPNIIGSFSLVNHNPTKHVYTGAFGQAAAADFPVPGLNSGPHWIEGWGIVAEFFNASLSSSIYGNSSHVTPESLTVVMGVIAIGSVASIGEATEEGIVAELGEHGAKFSEYLPLSGGVMTGTLVSATMDRFPAIRSNLGKHEIWFTEDGSILLRPDGSFENQVQIINGLVYAGLSPLVKTVNGVAADEAGNVTLGEVKILEIQALNGNGNTMRLPAGGTWYWFGGWRDSSNYTRNMMAGLNAGGTQVLSDSKMSWWHILAFRVA